MQGHPVAAHGDHLLRCFHGIFHTGNGAFAPADIGHVIGQMRSSRRPPFPDLPDHFFQGGGIEQLETDLQTPDFLFRGECDHIHGLIHGGEPEMIQKLLPLCRCPAAGIGGKIGDLPPVPATVFLFKNDQRRNAADCFIRVEPADDVAFAIDIIFVQMTGDEQIAFFQSVGKRLPVFLRKTAERRMSHKDRPGRKVLQLLRIHEPPAGGIDHPEGSLFFINAFQDLRHPLRHFRGA